MISPIAEINGSLSFLKTAKVVYEKEASLVREYNGHNSGLCAFESRSVYLQDVSALVGFFRIAEHLLRIYYLDYFLPRNRTGSQIICQSVPMITKAYALVKAMLHCASRTWPSLETDGWRGKT